MALDRAFINSAIIDIETKKALNSLVDTIEPRVLAITDATFTLTEKLDGRLIALNRAAGIAVALPAAYGSGMRFEFFLAATVTSNTTTIKVANAADTMAGFALTAQDSADTAVMFETAATSDTITLNGTTTGGTLGDNITLTDVAANVWSVRVFSAATGTEATCFSATVS
jgi:hypothetical protein